MIRKINNPTRLNVGDSFVFERKRLVRINKIDGKKITVTDEDDGTVIEIEFFQEHSKSYRYNYTTNVNYARGSGMNSRYGISLGSLYDYGMCVPIVAGEHIEYCVDGKQYKGMVSAVGSFKMTKDEITFKPVDVNKNAIVVVENGKTCVIIGCNQTLYFVEPDENNDMWINDTHICTIKGYKA